MQVFLTRAYDKLKKDSGRNKQTLSLRDSCDAAADALAAGNGGGSLVRPSAHIATELNLWVALRDTFERLTTGC